jgi:hypothetical protein
MNSQRQSGTGMGQSIQTGKLENGVLPIGIEFNRRWTGRFDCGPKIQERVVNDYAPVSLKIQVLRKLVIYYRMR